MININNFRHEFQLIDKGSDQQICGRIKFRKCQSEPQRPKQDFYFQKQSLMSNNQNNISQFLYFGIKDIIQLPKPSQVILSFCQSYEDILKTKNEFRQNYGIKQILIQFYHDGFSNKSFEYSQQQNVALNIVIQSSKVIIHSRSADPQTILFENHALFDDFSQNNPLKELQSKFWLELNNKLNKISLHVGDIQSIQSKKTVLFTKKLIKNVKKKNFDWKHCQKQFDDEIKSSKIQKQLQENLNNLTHCKIFLTVFQRKQQSSAQKNDEQAQIKDQAQFTRSLLISIFPPQIIKSPKISTNPNLFHQDISLINSLPLEIQTLYYRMKEMNLLTICQQYSDFKDICLQKVDSQMIGQLINNSLITPWGYVKDKNGHDMPIGILNHLLYIKTDKKYQPVIPFKNHEQLYNQITTNRQGYIRFEIIHPHRQYPGNCGVLEIWPPFYSSPIHNHGKLTGVIKVLKGEVRVENYASLSCNQVKQAPYAKRDYSKGNCTWLSRQSYGVHRVMNLAPVTAITLQAYYDHNQGSQEYFTFVKRDTENKQNPKFARYYPQHDWENYLNMKSMQNESDCEFVKKVIDCYGLKNQHEELDCSFGRFIKALEKQYYLIKSIIDDEGN